MPFSPLTAIGPFSEVAVGVPAAAPEPVARIGSSASMASGRLKTLSVEDIPAGRETETESSASAEARLPLVDERGHALSRVLAGEKVAEALGLRLEVLGVVSLERIVRRGLRGGQRERALRCEHLRCLHHLLQQLAR